MSRLVFFSSVRDSSILFRFAFLLNIKVPAHYPRLNLSLDTGMCRKFTIFLKDSLNLNSNSIVTQGDDDARRLGLRWTGCLVICPIIPTNTQHMRVTTNLVSSLKDNECYKSFSTHFQYFPQEIWYLRAVSQLFLCPN